MKKVKNLSLCFLCLVHLLISGCWDQKIFEEIGLALALGLEQTENGEILYSMTMPVFAEDIEETVEILSTTSNLLRQSRDQIRNTSGKQVEGGKIQHIIFSKELAEKGINNIIDVFLRSSENPLLANIIVVDGNPLEMLKISRDYKDKPRFGVYMANVIRDARTRAATPEIRIYEFTILQYSGTIDPIASYISYDDKGIKIEGSALFNKNKMVGNIGFVETGLLYALMGERIQFGYYIEAQNIKEETDSDKRGIAILLKRVKRKVKTNVNGTIPEINISLDFTGAVDEIDLDYRLDDPEDKKTLEDKISILIKQDCMKLLKYLQEIGSDPIGFGEIIRAKHNEYFKSVSWKSIYPGVKFDIDVKLNFEFYGATN
jgi:Ger(x)C family germination protein